MPDPVFSWVPAEKTANVRNRVIPRAPPAPEPCPSWRLGLGSQPVAKGRLVKVLLRPLLELTILMCLPALVFRGHFDCLGHLFPLSSRFPVQIWHLTRQYSSASVPLTCSNDRKPSYTAVCRLTNGSRLLEPSCNLDVANGSDIRLVSALCVGHTWRCSSKQCTYLDRPRTKSPNGGYQQTYRGCGVDRHACLEVAEAFRLTIVHPLAPPSLVTRGGSAARFRAGTSPVSILPTASVRVRRGMDRLYGYVMKKVR